MDKNIKKLILNFIKSEVGDLTNELKTRFKPLETKLNIMQESNDIVAEQIAEDRKDINQLKIDVSNMTAQMKVIIDNQNHMEDRMVDVIREASGHIPKDVKKSVDQIFEKKSWVTIFMEKFYKKK
jgi:hypothetical protein